jgi:hypothetical protein
MNKVKRSSENYINPTTGGLLAQSAGGTIADMLCLISLGLETTLLGTTAALGKPGL